MKKTFQHRFGLKSMTAACLAGAVSISTYAPLAAAHSDGAVWGIGGLLAGTMLGRASASKHEHQSTQSKAPASTPTPASTAPMTAEQKMQQLNALAAGGYITPQEYKTEKQAILNSLTE
jgi:hypothetical protein